MKYIYFMSFDICYKNETHRVVNSEFIFLEPITGIGQIAKKENWLLTENRDKDLIKEVTAISFQLLRTEPTD